MSAVQNAQTTSSSSSAQDINVATVHSFHGRGHVNNDTQEFAALPHPRPPVQPLYSAMKKESERTIVRVSDDGFTAFTARVRGTGTSARPRLAATGEDESTVLALRFAAVAAALWNRREVGKVG